MCLDVCGGLIHMGKGAAWKINAVARFLYLLDLQRLFFEKGLKIAEIPGGHRVGTQIKPSEVGQDSLLTYENKGENPKKRHCLNLHVRFWFFEIKILSFTPCSLKSPARPSPHIPCQPLRRNPWPLPTDNWQLSVQLLTPRPPWAPFHEDGPPDVAGEGAVVGTVPVRGGRDGSWSPQQKEKHPLRRFICLYCYGCCLFFPVLWWMVTML